MEGKSAAEVALWIGVDAERMRKWEQRDTGPKDPTDIKKIESYFKYNIDDLDKLDNFKFYDPSKETYIQKRRQKKNELTPMGMPVFESAPVTLSNIESYRDEKQNEPDFWLSIPQYRKCNYACRAKGDSMHPIVRNHALVGGMQLQSLDVIIFGDIYIIHTSNQIETIKYIHPDPDNAERLLLVPFNKEAKTTPIYKKDIVRLYQAQFVLNPI